jgi:hypothetical protein
MIISRTAAALLALVISGALPGAISSHAADLTWGDVRPVPCELGDPSFVAGQAGASPSPLPKSAGAGAKRRATGASSPAGGCPQGACGFRECPEPVSCRGGGCIFERCGAPTCEGGGCKFVACGALATCPGGGCDFADHTASVLVHSFCDGGGCTVDGFDVASDATSFAACE